MKFIKQKYKESPWFKLEQTIKGFLKSPEKVAILIIIVCLVAIIISLGVLKKEVSGLNVKTLGAFIIAGKDLSLEANTSSLPLPQTPTPSLNLIMDLSDFTSASIKFKQILIRTITAYTLSSEETDDTPCIGAWGDNLCELQRKLRDPFIMGIGLSESGFNFTLLENGMYICASNEFPRLTKLKIIEGEDICIGCWRECVVLDRMNSRYKNRIDILFNNYENAINFGVQELEVKIIN